MNTTAFNLLAALSNQLSRACDPQQFDEETTRLLAQVHSFVDNGEPAQPVGDAGKEAVAILRRISNWWPATVVAPDDESEEMDEEEEVNGGDAVEFLGELVVEDIRPLLTKLSSPPEPALPTGADAVIAGIKAAANASEEEYGVLAAVEVSWCFVAVLDLEPDEIRGLDEKRLRASLGERVLEMISMTGDAGEALDKLCLLEVREN